MYARMARYYMPTLFFGLLSCCLFLWLMSARPGRAAALGWIAYTLSNMLLLFSSYVAGAVLIAQVVLVLLRWKDYRQHVREWIASMAVAGAAIGVWYAYTLPYIARYPLNPADFAEGLSSYAVKLVYPIYSFAVGETLFPWRIPAIAGLAAAAILSLAGVWRLRTRLADLAFLVTGFGVSILVVVLSTVWFVVDVPFLNIPSRAFFAARFLYVLIAAGVGALRSPAVRAAALAVLALCAAAGLSNYYRGLEFHNPIYAVPAREIVAEVRAQLETGDVIVNEPDSGFSYYYPRNGDTTPLWSSYDALPLLQAQRPPRVWLVTFGRDATRGVTNAALKDWLDLNYRLTLEKGYVEQNPTYRMVKERLLHREAYRYKLVVQQYTLP